MYVYILKSGAAERKVTFFHKLIDDFNDCLIWCCIGFKKL